MTATRGAPAGVCRVEVLSGPLDPPDDPVGRRSLPRIDRFAVIDVASNANHRALEAGQAGLQVAHAVLVQAAKVTRFVAQRLEHLRNETFDVVGHACICALPASRDFK